VDPSLSRVHLLPVPDSLPRHLSEAASAQLEAYVQARLSSPDPTIRLVNACFFVLAHTGLRAQECVDLQRQDLDLPAGRLRVRLGKGQRERVVYLSTLSQQALDLYLAATPHAPTDPLWQLPDGQPLTYPRLYDAIRAVGQAAGVADVTPHRLRHTLATRLLNSGMDVTRIQKLLGHEHLSTTLIYARVADTTVEHDYRQAMDQVESQQPPLSTTPIAVADWPLPVTADTALALPELCLQPAQLAYNQLDNSV
jgi:site-specific recombinase XerD